MKTSVVFISKDTISCQFSNDVISMQLEAYGKQFTWFEENIINIQSNTFTYINGSYRNGDADIILKILTHFNKCTTSTYCKVNSEARYAFNNGIMFFNFGSNTSRFKTSVLAGLMANDHYLSNWNLDAELKKMFKTQFKVTELI